jgi:hypothetical protein
MSAEQWIFCSGMPRSASTWSYNVARLLTMKRQNSVWANFADTPETLDKQLGEAEKQHETVAVFKFHKASERVMQLLQAGIAVNVFTYRHPLAAIASWREIFGLPLDIAVRVTTDALRDMDRYRRLPGTLFVAMRDVVQSGYAATERVASHLGYSSLSPEQIAEVACTTSTDQMAKMAESLRVSKTRLIDVGFTRYDPVTHLHVGHINRGLDRNYRHDLTEDEIAICRAALQPWFPAYESW